MKHHLARYARAVDFTTQPAEYFAYHDLLTGLPNRAAFERASDRYRRSGVSDGDEFCRRSEAGELTVPFAIWLSSLTKYTANLVKTPAQNLLHRLKSGP